MLKMPDVEELEFIISEKQRLAGHLFGSQKDINERKQSAKGSPDIETTKQVNGRWRKAPGVQKESGKEFSSGKTTDPVSCKSWRKASVIQQSSEVVNLLVLRRDGAVVGNKLTTSQSCLFLNEIGKRGKFSHRKSMSCQDLSQLKLNEAKTRSDNELGRDYDGLKKTVPKSLESLPPLEQRRQIRICELVELEDNSFAEYKRLYNKWTKMQKKVCACEDMVLQTKYAQRELYEIFKHFNELTEELSANKRPFLSNLGNEKQKMFYFDHIGSFYFNKVPDILASYYVLVERNEDDQLERTQERSYSGLSDDLSLVLIDILDSLQHYFVCLQICMKHVLSCTPRKHHDHRPLRETVQVLNKVNKENASKKCADLEKIRSESCPLPDVNTKSKIKRRFSWDTGTLKKFVQISRSMSFLRPSRKQSSSRKQSGKRVDTPLERANSDEQHHIAESIEFDGYSTWHSTPRNGKSSQKVNQGRPGRIYGNKEKGYSRSKNQASCSIREVDIPESSPSLIRGNLDFYSYLSDSTSSPKTPKNRIKDSLKIPGNFKDSNGLKLESRMEIKKKLIGNSKLSRNGSIDTPSQLRSSSVMVKSDRKVSHKGRGNYIGISSKSVVEESGDKSSELSFAASCGEKENSREGDIAKEQSGNSRGADQSKMASEHLIKNLDNCPRGGAHEKATSLKATSEDSHHDGEQGGKNWQNDVKDHNCEGKKHTGTESVDENSHFSAVSDGNEIKNDYWKENHPCGNKYGLESEKSNDGKKSETNDFETDDVLTETIRNDDSPVKPIIRKHSDIVKGSDKMTTRQKPFKKHSLPITANSNQQNTDNCLKAECCYASRQSTTPPPKCESSQLPSKSSNIAGSRCSLEKHCAQNTKYETFRRNLTICSDFNKTVRTMLDASFSCMELYRNGITYGNSTFYCRSSASHGNQEAICRPIEHSSHRSTDYAVPFSKQNDKRVSSYVEKTSSQEDSLSKMPPSRIKPPYGLERSADLEKCRSFMGIRASKKPEVGQKECNGATVEHRNKKISKHKAIKWANGIDELLLDKRGVRVFQVFLKSEYSEENVLFWLACENFKSTSSSKVAKEAMLIYNSFIEANSAKEVNLDHDTRMKIKDAIKKPDKKMFDQAQRRIKSLMAQDSYPRFLKSLMYRELVS